MENLPATQDFSLPAPIHMGLTPEQKQSLKNADDVARVVINSLGAIEVNKWVVADALLYYFDNYGGGYSLKEFVANIGEPEYSTAGTWIRTARAFPIEKRIPSLTFTHHYRASFADSYNKMTNQFEGDERFDFLEQADAARWTAEELENEITRKKKLREFNIDVLPCALCGNNKGDIHTFNFYSRSSDYGVEKRELHNHCFENVLQYIDNYGKKN